MLSEVSTRVVSIFERIETSAKRQATSGGVYVLVELPRRRGIIKRAPTVRSVAVIGSGIVRSTEKLPRAAPKSISPMSAETENVYSPGSRSPCTLRLDTPSLVNWSKNTFPDGPSSCTATELRRDIPDVVPSSEIVDDRL